MTKAALPSQHRYIIFLHKHDAVHVVTNALLCARASTISHDHIFYCKPSWKKGWEFNEGGIFNLLADVVAGHFL
jgi:hypothetical protein